MACDIAVLPSAKKTASASSSLSFGAGSHGPPYALSTLRSLSRPSATQDSLSGVCQAPAGVGHPVGPFEDFRIRISAHASSSQASPGATSCMFNGTLVTARRI